MSLGNRRVGHGIYSQANQQGWNRQLSRASTQEGLQDFRFHDLRHTTASYLAMNGATPTDIAAVLGHKSIAMAQRYSHLAPSHVDGVVAKMNQKIFEEN
jgi:integrase